ncbi:MAG: 3-methylornithine--L-lysine ligase PylC [Methanomassiliicoccus sp.]|nr:MAG: 3-methylornithine--L-lysine ligase PylC [Methanomassiliicoccus sp.]
MRIGVVGGALQGMESVYLARKAGYSTLVLDRWEDAPALSLADETLVVDVVRDPAKTKNALGDCDAILPANENYQALTAVVSMAEELGIPLLFDLNAYEISQSKIRSNDLFAALDIPMPAKWPGCGFPAIVKPTIGSGSTGVMKVQNEMEMMHGVENLKNAGLEWVVEEYVHGPNISIEIVGDGTEFVPYVITEVILDEDYDCKRVRSPYTYGSDLEEKFAEAAYKVARRLGLRGIMDVEAIVMDGVAKVLEIDARIPSQTPAAVLNSHGINLVEQLVKGLVCNDLQVPMITEHMESVYEHICIEGDVMRSCGEGVFASVRSPYIVRGLFGVDEMITDYQPGKCRWVATLMMSAPTERALMVKREACLERIMEENDIVRYLDLFPEGYFDTSDR